jgi:hypothetical protein
MKKNIYIMLTVLCCLSIVVTSTAVAETVTQKMYLDENNTMWVTVNVWRDSGKTYAEFTPSEDISDVSFLETFYLWAFTIEQNGIDYEDFDDFLFFYVDEQDNKNNDSWVHKIEDRYIKTQIKTSENKEYPDDIQHETDLDLNKAFLLKYDGGYHDYTMSISAESSGGGGGGGCFIDSISK